MSWKDSVKVAVAIIIDAKQRVLITKRSLKLSHGGLWEFPGGKVEHDEGPTQALVREIKEEVDLDVKQCHFLGEINHDYSGKQVTLLIYHVTDFLGQAQCREHQTDLRWVNLDTLDQYTFPEANLKIIEMLSSLTIA